jgi:hemerythrin-like domain-containing protein
LKELAEFYPKHIEKEDKNFFFPCMEYFTKNEQDVMLDEFWEFDRNLIHEKYRKMVKGYKR